MRHKLYICAVLVVGLAGAGTTLAFALANNRVQANNTSTIMVSCCPDGPCCPGPCCDLTATKSEAKKASCCPDGDCCPDGACCTVSTKIALAKASCCPDGVCCPGGPCFDSSFNTSGK